jgi:hypothetical protein
MTFQSLLSRLGNVVEILTLPRSDCGVSKITRQPHFHGGDVDARQDLANQAELARLVGTYPMDSAGHAANVPATASPVRGSAAAPHDRGVAAG